MDNGLYTCEDEGKTAHKRTMTDVNMRPKIAGILRHLKQSCGILQRQIGILPSSKQPYSPLEQSSTIRMPGQHWLEA